MRADNGASMSRLRFAGEEMGRQETNLIAANGRIVDVDIAAESTRMAKYNALGSSLGFDACPSEHERRRRSDAPEVTRQ